MKRVRPLYILTFLAWISVTSCATEIPSVVSAPPYVANALIGKTQQELLACTAVNPSERALEGVTELMFYKEASILEESFPVSKGSFPQTHHGCLAHVELRDGRVDSIHYHTVPMGYQGFDHCDAIFEPCLAH